MVLGIAGCSGSGKTTLARELAAQLNATLFPLDFYYNDLAHLTLDERKQVNYDHPDSMEDALLVAHVSALAKGRGIDRPIYDFAAHTRVIGETERIAPAVLSSAVVAMETVPPSMP